MGIFDSLFGGSNSAPSTADFKHIIPEIQATRDRGGLAALGSNLEHGHGNLGASGMPEAFHLYSMRQAIEEEFILDVLATTASTHFGPLTDRFTTGLRDLIRPGLR